MHVVFDGYLESSTKDHCHQKRAPVNSLLMDLSDLSKTLLCKKPVFLSNPSNKQQFINALADALQSAGYMMCHIALLIPTEILS